MNILKKHALATSAICLIGLPWILQRMGILQDGDYSTIMALGNLMACIAIGIVAFIFARRKNVAFRTGVFIGLTSLSLLYWIIPAVGIFGADGHSMDLWYAPLLAVSIIASSVLQYESRALRTIFVILALAQLIIGIYFAQLQMSMPEQYEIDRIVQIFFMNGFFASLYILAAIYFHESYQMESEKDQIKIHMTDFIHLNSLMDRLKRNEINNLEEMLFLLANWCVFGFLSFVFVNQQYDNPGVIIMLTLLPTIGLFISYRSNSKGDGKDFLKRLIPLHFNLGIRFMILSFISLLLSSKIGQFIEHPAIKGFFIGGMFFGVILTFYISLSRSMAKVSAPK
jgi:hypothetical protein